MNTRWICSILLTGLLLLCIIPAVQADESTNLTNEAILLIHGGSTNYARAIALIDEAFAINSSAFGNRLEGLELKSYAQIQLGNYTGAAATIDQALAIEESAVLWNNKGYILYLQNDYADAVDAYTRALTINPAYTVALINRGNAMMELKNYPGAVDSYTKALASDKDVNALTLPVQEKTWNNLGEAYYSLGNYTASAAAYQSALKIDPTNTTATAGLARASQQTQPWTFLTIAALAAVIVIVCTVIALVIRKRKPAAPEKKRSRKSRK